MFNIGGDDKEKLEENMEEIKQLVNEGKEEPQEENTQEEIQQDAEGVENLEGFDQTAPEQASEVEEDQDVEKMEDELEEIESSIKQENNDTQSQINEVQNQHSQEGQAPIGDQLQPETPDEEVNQTQTQESHSTNSGREDRDIENLKNQIEDHINSIEEGRSNRTIEEDVEEINKERKEERKQKKGEEALFLDVESFEDIREMIEEMHYLTTEMDDIMEHLVVGVEEDQKTVDEAGQIIDEFRSRRNRIEETLKQN